MTLTEEQAAVLRILFNAKPKLRKAMLEHADKKLICTICECVLNITCGNVKVDEKQKQKLAKHKNLLRRVVKKTANWKDKKKIIQKGGNFLIPLLIPIIGSLIAKLF